MVLQPISLFRAVTAADAVRLRRDRVDPVEAYARAQAHLREVFTDQTAVVQFGAEALDLAHGSLKSNPDATAPDLFDTLDLESGLFAYEEAQSPLESGFFPSTNATSADWLSPRSLDDGVESTFPPAPVNDTLDSTFPQASNGTRESLAPNSDAIIPQAPADNGFTTLAQNEHQARADERAQRAPDGGYSGGVQLSSEVGPNGKRYVDAAEVPPDVTPVPGDPAATLRKMAVIIRAATSDSPSIGDRNVAAEAQQLARRARAELAAQRYAEAQRF